LFTTRDGLIARPFTFRVTNNSIKLRSNFFNEGIEKRKDFFILFDFVFNGCVDFFAAYVDFCFCLRESRCSSDFDFSIIKFNIHPPYIFTPFIGLKNKCFFTVRPRDNIGLEKWFLSMAADNNINAVYLTS